MDIIKVTGKNYEEEVMQADQKVLIDFWASWCGPCRMLSPIVDEVAQENPSVKVCKVNVDEEPELAQKFHVVSIPMLVVMEQGKAVKKSIGFIQKDEVLALLQ